MAAIPHHRNLVFRWLVEKRPSGAIDVVPVGYADIHRRELEVLADLAGGDRSSVSHQLRRLIGTSTTPAAYTMPFTGEQK